MLNWTPKGRQETTDEYAAWVKSVQKMGSEQEKLDAISTHFKEEWDADSAKRVAAIVRPEANEYVHGSIDVGALLKKFDVGDRTVILP